MKNVIALVVGLVAGYFLGTGQSHEWLIAGQAKVQSLMQTEAPAAPADTSAPADAAPAN